MNLNYDKIKSKVEHGGNHWTSYSDLFLVLSVVFLLLYVVANLRNGTMSIAQVQQLRVARQEADELKRQIKAYDLLKQDYLKQGASSDEIQMYQELMGKLTLLEGEAKSERDALYQQAKDAEEKEQNLNRYQQMVKNIISANLVANQRLKKRDIAIEERDNAILERNSEIDSLSHTVQKKEAVIRQNTQTIGQIELKLAEQIHDAQNAYRVGKATKAQLESRIATLKADSARQVDSLRKENDSYMSQLQTAQATLAAKNRQTEQLIARLGQQEGKYQEAIGALEKAHQDALAREKAGYESGLKRGNASLQSYKSAVEQQNEAYNAQLNKLKGELAGTRDQMKGLQGKYQGDMQALAHANDALAKDLQATSAKLNEQRMLAQNIKEKLRRAGIDADVDLKTGDVTINFQNEYFDTGRAELKPGMLNTLTKFMPAYANSLFKDPKIAKRIGSVEIVGFASPTYKGKYVDPESLKPEDRIAVNFNMDLSYQRAKAIFEHAFDTSKMQFSHQKELLPLVKVTGRSYLATERLPGRTTASGGEYCQTFDCKKSQRVIIKFNLRDE